MVSSELDPVTAQGEDPLPGSDGLSESVGARAGQPLSDDEELPRDDVADPGCSRAPGSPGVNAVTLRGRVSTAPELRELPSGTRIVTLRVSVARDPSPMTRGSKQTPDWVDCVAWGSRQRRRVAGWRVGDVVEVEGALRRRFYRGGAGTAMRLEVEVLGGRLRSRAKGAVRGHA